ncbi:MAG: AMP-binding protein [Leptospirales bacterium]|nr:AMP-binding protein [Leptospirales bacterium]
MIGTPTSIGALFLDQCEIYEEAIALAFVDKLDVKTVSYARMRRIVEEMAGGLAGHGLSAGKRVLIVGSNTPEWIFSYFAVQLCGGVDVAVNPEISRSTILTSVRRLRIDLAIVEDPDLADQLERARVRCYRMNWKHDRSRNLSTLKKGFRLFGPGFRRRSLNDVASILFKNRDPELRAPGGIVLKHKAILANLDAFGSTLPTLENDRLLLRLPLWHSSGRLGLLTALSKGCELQLSRDDFVQDCKRMQPTVAMARPETLADLYMRAAQGRDSSGVISTLLLRGYMWFGIQSMRLLGNLTGQKAVFKAAERPTLLDLFLDVSLLIVFLPFKMLGDALFGARLRQSLGGNLKSVLTGGGPIPERIDLFLSMLGISMLAGYWKTEAAHVISSRILEYTGQRSRLQPGTVGPPLPGAEIKIVQAGQDVSHTPGAIGEIMIRGDFLFSGYLDPAQASVDSSGWFYTEDRGCLSDQGELRIV